MSAIEQGLEQIARVGVGGAVVETRVGGATLAGRTL